MKKSKDDHAFRKSDACQHGVDEAIILFDLRFWLKLNLDQNKNIHDGRVWTYNTTKDIAERIPYLSKHQIYRRLKKLESKGIIITGNYNKMKYDQTKWYTIDEPEYVISQDCKMEIIDSYNQNDGSVKPIPDAIPDSPISKDIGVGIDTDLKGITLWMKQVSKKTKEGFQKPENQLNTHFGLISLVK